jgi:hypothetical protein
MSRDDKDFLQLFPDVTTTWYNEVGYHLSLTWAVRIRQLIFARERVSNAQTSLCSTAKINRMRNGLRGYARWNYSFRGTREDKKGTRENWNCYERFQDYR